MIYRGLGNAECDILLDGGVQQHYVLRHIGDSRLPRCAVRISDGNPVDFDVTGFRYEQSRDQIDQRRFTRTVRPDQADGGPGENSQRYAACRQRSIRRITEGDFFEAYFPLWTRAPRGIHRFEGMLPGARLA